MRSLSRPQQSNECLWHHASILQNSLQKHSQNPCLNTIELLETSLNHWSHPQTSFRLSLAYIFVTPLVEMAYNYFLLRSHISRVANHLLTFGCCHFTWQRAIGFFELALSPRQKPWRAPGEASARPRRGRGEALNQ